MLIGYARVSKADGSQSLDLQRDALRTGDVLVVWKLDRLGRTLAHLVTTRAGPVGPRRGPAGAHRARRADRHHRRRRPPRVRHLPAARPASYQRAGGHHPGSPGARIPRDR